jgi:hypothetical protein
VADFILTKKASVKGTVQRKLTGVLSGINRQLMISQSVAWYFYLFKEPWPHYPSTPFLQVYYAAEKRLFKFKGPRLFKFK